METKPDLASRGLTIGRNGETVEPWKQGNQLWGNGETVVTAVNGETGKPAFQLWLGQSEISPVFVSLGVSNTCQPLPAIIVCVENSNLQVASAKLQLATCLINQLWETND